MEFKIDTKEKILIVHPEIPRLDVNLSVEFAKSITDLPELKDRNLILDMALVPEIDEAGLMAILTVYQQQYDSRQSCAITGLNNTLTGILRESYEDLNITPTLAEAIDIVMMESLERELMEGEEW